MPRDPVFKEETLDTLQKHTKSELTYDTSKMDYYAKHKIIVAFLELLHEHDTGIYSLSDNPINLNPAIINVIPDSVVKEYERIRLEYEEQLKSLIKIVETLPTHHL